MKSFKPYDVNQRMLLPLDLKDCLGGDHLSLFISDAVESLDLSMIYRSYDEKSRSGQPPLHPKMLLKLLIYGYSVGIRSSRKLEKAALENVAFKVLAASQCPDHQSINRFRKRHLKALPSVFSQVLSMCRDAGLLKVGHVSFDGTKIKANAKKSKSRKYDYLVKQQGELDKQIAEMLGEAESVDAYEDRLYGKDKRGDELPEHLRSQKGRLKVIKELLAKIEAEANEKREANVEEKKEKKEEDEDWRKESGFGFELRPPINLKNKRTAEIIKSRRNPTDYDSRIMKDHQTGGFIQGFNCQLAVDADSQVILGHAVTNAPTDKQLLPSLLKQVIKNTQQTPAIVTADNGYFSERDIVKLEALGVDPYIPPTKDAIGKRKIRTNLSGRIRTITQHMNDKLATKTGKKIYRQRKTIVEPVFGQLKQNRNFRQFLLRGLEKVQGEWELLAIAHNLGKLHACAT